MAEPGKSRSDDLTRDIRVPAPIWRSQIENILAALGMHREEAQIAAEVLGAADLMGIESHGAAMLPLYADQCASGGSIIDAKVEIVRDLAAVALLDGGGGFGQVPGMMAVDMAAEKAKAFGIAAIAIRNSNHYGAAGVYARRLAERGLIGVSTSSVWRAAIVPTGGIEAKLGTNPIAFSAPAARNRPFLLDLATSTAAIGKIKLAARVERSLPDGWALTAEGAPERDPEAALLNVLLSPLGGHKGYGLATMVEILSSTLSGATQTPLRGAPEKPHDVGHFIMAMDPGLLRGSQEAFEEDLADMLEGLRRTRSAESETTVLVAGDPEYAHEDERLKHGIPLPPKLGEQLRALTRRIGAEYLLEPETTN